MLTPIQSFPPSLTPPSTGANSRGRCDRREIRGITLIEVLVAMVVLGLCLVFMTQLLVQDSFVEKRLRAREASLRLLEAHTEIVRAGLPLPDEEGTYDMELLVEPAYSSGLEALSLQLVLEELEPRGLWRVDLEMSYRSGQQSFEESVEMRLWRP